MTTDYTHPEYDKCLPKWTKVRDVCAGQDAIKAKGETYLPDPDETCADPIAGAARYRRYLRRAVFFNATGRTAQGLLGVAYANWPAVNLRYKALLDDADGSGVGLINQSQAVLSDVLQTGRAGILADWTKGDGLGVPRRRTLAQSEAAGVRPFIVAYTAEQILTWETSGTTLTRVVLAETRELHEGGEVEFLPRLRELLLTEAGYVVKLWTKHTDRGEFYLEDTIEIGLPYIPFAFVGAVNNDPHPDKSPLLDLADLNLAHYCNSADFEESAFLMGQPQLVIIGATDEWKAATGAITFGSRSALVAPPDGDAKLLQVAPNTLAKEAMLDKERLMALLGARLLAPGEAAKTATQSASETRAAYSPLVTACDNLSAAYTRALKWVETWGRGGASDASFAIDTDFSEMQLDANAIRETVAAWQSGLVPQSDAVAVLQRLRVIDQGKTAEQVQAEVDAAGPALSLDDAA